MSKKVAIGLPAVLLGGLLASSFFVGGAESPDNGCIPTGDGIVVNVANLPDSVGPYSGEQLKNAALIINAGKKMGLSRHAQTIAVMTAIGESTLNNLDRGDAVGPDSRGLFQQRASGWGSLEDRMNPPTAATNFYKALLEVHGWEDLAPTLAAHRVQSNADPYHYAQHWRSAQLLVSALEGAQITEAGSTNVDTAKTIKAYNLGSVQDVTARAVAVLAPQFKIATVGGYRPNDPYPDHPSGLAADFMVPLTDAGTAKGDALAQYLTENHEELGVKYLLWQQRSWYPDRGWKPMDNRGSPTANHQDHVHVTFQGNAGTGALPAASACMDSEADSVFAAPGERVMPSKGPITSPFGMRMHPTLGYARMHAGIDIGAPCDAAIRAPSKGRVVYAGPMGGYGHLIAVDHGQGTTTRYGHMYGNGLLARVGDEVQAGQQIAKVGNDGESSGCHLHFEVRVDDQPIDPQKWIAKGKA